MKPRKEMYHKLLWGWQWVISESLSPIRAQIIYGIFMQSLHTAGDVAEFGCYEGHTSRELATYLKYNVPHKNLHVFDSFMGLNNPGEHDITDKEADLIKATNYVQGLKDGQEYICQGSFEDVRDGFIEAKLHNVLLYQGYFDEWKDDFKEDLCFALIDADLYESTRSAIEIAKPLISPGGVIVFDDYGADKFWPGVKKAVDEVFAEDPEWDLMCMGSEPVWLASAWRRRVWHKPLVVEEVRDE